jgi:transposase-like protein
MPWKESDAMDQRLQFVTDALSDRFTMTEFCARYGVSRRVGYKWVARFQEDGKRGLTDRTRRPHTCPTQIRSALAELLCEFTMSSDTFVTYLPGCSGRTKRAIAFLLDGEREDRVRYAERPCSDAKCI